MPPHQHDDASYRPPHEWLPDAVDALAPLIDLLDFPGRLAVAREVRHVAAEFRSAPCDLRPALHAARLAAGAAALYAPARGAEPLWRRSAAVLGALRPDAVATSEYAIGRAAQPACLLTGTLVHLTLFAPAVLRVHCGDDPDGAVTVEAVDDTRVRLTTRRDTIYRNAPATRGQLSRLGYVPAADDDETVAQFVTNEPRAAARLVASTLRIGHELPNGTQLVVTHPAPAGARRP